MPERAYALVSSLASNSLALSPSSLHLSGPLASHSLASHSLSSNALSSNALSNVLASALMAGVLAAASLPGFNMTASAAADCLDRPDFKITQQGHWYYRQERASDRRCWHFEPAEAAPGPQAPAPAVTAAPAATPDEQPQQQSPLLQFLSQTFAAPPQQVQETQENSIPDNATETVQTVSPKPAKPVKPVRRERPPAAATQVRSTQAPATQAPATPAPVTNGAAVTERDPQQQASADKNEKRDPPSNVAAREALYQDFMKWQLERNVFGRGL
jgi:hypothetical protein